MACDSTLLKAAAYHAQFAVLERTFHSGAVYRYFGVPALITISHCGPNPRAGISIPTFAIASSLQSPLQGSGSNN
jgi:hypothetical protein